MAADPQAHLYSRKDKSLGLLCDNFIAIYVRGQHEEICIDETAKTLSVERRRIYDIVNVLESVGVVLRRGKNKYAWYGTDRLQKTLDALDDDARNQGSFTTDDGIVAPILQEHASPLRIGAGIPTGGYADATQPESIGAAMAAIASSAMAAAESTVYDLRPQLSTVESPLGVGRRRRSAPPASSVPIVAPAVTPEGVVGAEAKSDSRKDKALGILSQRFVKLFLLNGTEPLSLEEAAAWLLGGTLQTIHPSKLKTKVRRLYDVANILCSLKLIEKCTTADRKPAFRWHGPNEGTLNPEIKPRKRPGMAGTQPAPPATRKRKTRSRDGPDSVDGRDSAGAPDTSGVTDLDDVPDTAIHAPDAPEDCIASTGGVTGTAADGCDRAGSCSVEQSAAANDEFAVGVGEESREEENSAQLEQWKAAAGEGKSVVGSTSMECLEKFDVDDYMRRAKQAGPDYYFRAQNWLRVYLEWKARPKTSETRDETEQTDSLSPPDAGNV